MTRTLTAMSGPLTAMRSGLGISTVASAGVLAAWSGTSMAVALLARRLPERLSSPSRLAIGLTLCAFYHLAAGIRHLIWDTGAGLKPKSADAAVTLSIWFAVIATVAYWAYLFASGKVAL